MTLELSVVPEKAVVVRRGKTLVTASWFGPAVLRPFLYPFLGPGEVEVTRLGHPKDLVSHSHHRSIWIGHNDVGGVDFWSENPRSGRIVQTGVELLASDRRDSSEVSFQLALSWRGPDDRELLRETRRITVTDLPGEELAADLEIELRTPGEDAVTLGVTNFGLLGIRVSTTLRVEEHLGGLILNSQEAENETGCFGQHATWCDYSGPVPQTRPASEGAMRTKTPLPIPGVVAGIACFDHPDNYNDHPASDVKGGGSEARWHVRDDGWMGPSLTRTEPRRIQPGQPLRARYRILAHAGRPWEARIDERYRSWRKS